MNDVVIRHSEIIAPEGAVALILADAKTGRIKDVNYVKNLITTAGKVSLAAALQGETANNQGIITYCAVGTNTTAPALGDTDLGTELFRKLVSVRSSTSNAALFQTYFTTSEGNGTLREAGLFGDDASSTPGSGTLFAHVAINRTKTSNDTLTINWTITIG